MSDLQSNPFQAPLAEPSYRPPDPETPSPPVPAKVFLKWLVICSVSAAPSFVIALMLARDGVWDEIAGMSLGIMVFVLSYTYLELRPEVQRLLSDPRKRLTAKIGYGIRIGMSILFPVGFYLDMIVGFVSVAITTSFLQGGSPDEFGGFPWHFSTTIVQGILLNIVLLTLMLLIYGLTLMFYRVDRPLHESVKAAEMVKDSEVAPDKVDKSEVDDVPTAEMR